MSDGRCTDGCCPTCGHKPNPRPLTPREATMLGIVIGKIDDVGYAPSIREMADAMDLRSLDGVKKLLGALEYKGWIRVEPKKTRAIDVIYRPAVSPLEPRKDLGDHPRGWPLLARRVQPVLARPGQGTPVRTAAKRTCLQCGEDFDSHGPGNRICDRCKSKGDWAMGNDLAVGA